MKTNLYDTLSELLEMSFQPGVTMATLQKRISQVCDSAKRSDSSENNIPANDDMEIPAFLRKQAG